MIELFLQLHLWPCMFVASMGKVMSVTGVKLDLILQLNGKGTNANVNSCPDRLYCM